MSFRGRGGSPCVILAIRLLRLLSSKAGRKREQLVQGQAQAVDVAAGVAPGRRTAPAPCSASVPTTAPVCVTLSCSIALASPKSVIQATPCESKQQIGRLDVAVQGMVGMGVVQGLGHLLADGGDAPPIRRPELPRRSWAGRCRGVAGWPPGGSRWLWYRRRGENSSVGRPAGDDGRHGRGSSGLAAVVRTVGTGVSSRAVARIALPAKALARRETSALAPDARPCRRVREAMPRIGFAGASIAGRRLPKPGQHGVQAHARMSCMTI